jgi:hypothetical protein
VQRLLHALMAHAMGVGHRRPELRRRRHEDPPVVYHNPVHDRPGLGCGVGRDGITLGDDFQQGIDFLAKPVEGSWTSVDQEDT